MLKNFSCPTVVLCVYFSLLSPLCMALLALFSQLCIFDWSFFHPSRDSLILTAWTVIPADSSNSTPTTPTTNSPHLPPPPRAHSQIWPTCTNSTSLTSGRRAISTDWAAGQPTLS